MIVCVCSLLSKHQPTPQKEQSKSISLHDTFAESSRIVLQLYNASSIAEHSKQWHGKELLFIICWNNNTWPSSLFTYSPLQAIKKQGTHTFGNGRPFFTRGGHQETTASNIFRSHRVVTVPETTTTNVYIRDSLPVMKQTAGLRAWPRAFTLTFNGRLRYWNCVLILSSQVPLKKKNRFRPFRTGYFEVATLIGDRTLI